MRFLLILLFAHCCNPVFAQFGSTTMRQIDEIKNNNGTDIILNPVDKVKLNYFSGEFALQSTVNGELEESAVTNTELDYLSGVTDYVQDQLDLKEELLPWLSNGDLVYYNSGNATALSIGTSGQILTVSAGLPSWQNAPISTTLTAKGDIQTHNGTANATLTVGTNGKVLSANSATATGLEWIDPPSSVSVTTKGDLQTHDGTNPERLPVGSNGKVLSANSAMATGLEWIDSPASSGALVVGSLQTIINGGTVTLIADDTRELIPVDGSGGAITLNTSPFGTYLGPNGKEVILITNEDTNTITINKNDAVDGAIIVGDYDSIEISYAHPVKAVRYNNRWYLSRGL